MLPGTDHGDYGPTLQVGLSSGRRNSLRPFVGLGGGPVQDDQGDDGMFHLAADGVFYLAVGASCPVSQQHGIFVREEVRYAVLEARRTRSSVLPSAPHDESTNPQRSADAVPPVCRSAQAGWGTVQLMAGPPTGR